MSLAQLGISRARSLTPSELVGDDLGHVEEALDRRRSIERPREHPHLERGGRFERDPGAILITGASGGVGHYVTELASAAGAEVTVVSASARRSDRLRALGAATVLSDLGAAEGPFDVVMESVGGDWLPQALALVRKGGQLLWFGQASRTPATLDFFALFEQTGASVRHFHYENSEIPVSQDLATLVRLVARGRLHPELGLVAHWSQTAGVLADLRDRRVRGKAVLCIPCGNPDHPRQKEQQHDAHHHG